jgi:hypothetical protein
MVLPCCCFVVNERVGKSLPALPACRAQLTLRRSRCMQEGTSHGEHHAAACTLAVSIACYMRCADTRCVCCAVCRDALRMEQTAKRSHHAEEVSSGVPRPAPHAMSSAWTPLSRGAVFVGASLLSPAILPSTRAAQQAATRKCPQPTYAFATTTAANAHVQPIILLPQPQQPLLLPRPLRLCRCSAVRAAASTS